MSNVLKVIKDFQLPCNQFKVQVLENDSGVVTSDLHDVIPVDIVPDPEDREYDAAATALELLVLAHACAGIDINASAYVSGLITAIQHIERYL